MRYKILNYIKQHPLCQIEEIVKYCHTSIESKYFLREFYNLYKNNFIDCSTHYDIKHSAYDIKHFVNKWVLTTKGNKAIFRRNKKLKKRKNKILDK